MSSIRVARVATVPFFLLHHLGGQIQFLAEAGHSVDIVCSRGPGCDELARIPGVRLINIEIPRRIAPLADAVALCRLYRLFRRSGYHVVHSTTPKAGLLSALAARAAGTPIRLHTFTGQHWKEMKGVLRWISRTCDRVILALNTQCYADSASQKEYLISEGIGDDKSLCVLGAGSLAGADVRRWETALANYRRAETWDALRVPQGIPLIVFVGRVTRDKGIVELIQAFKQVQSAGADCFLLVVGPMETAGDLELERELADMRANARFRLAGYDPKPENILAIADLLCLPSYREGFGNVVIEAGVMGIPTVGTSIVGLTDSIVPGVTGLLVPPKNARALADALLLLLRDEGARKRMGQAARERALALFDSARVNGLVGQEYERLCARLGIRNDTSQ
jgi:glycosyltransferase involved in cell wall biosynthesis